MGAATILVDHTAPKVVTNHIKATECPLLLHMSILHLQLQAALELLHFMAVIVLSEVSEYGRAGSAQAAQTPQGLGGSGAFGGHDAFGRGSSYQGQGQQHYNSQQGAQPGTSDELKPFGESKAANGP